MSTQEQSESNPGHTGAGTDPQGAINKGTRSSWWQDLLKKIGSLAMIASVFWAGWHLRSEVDESRIDFLKEQIQHLSASGDTLKIEDFFSNFDLAQMTPQGSYSLLVGASSVSAWGSTFSDSIRAAIELIRSGQYRTAQATLAWARNDMPSFPFLNFYDGLVQDALQQGRGLSYFNRAHADFSFLLKIKPNNSAMRLYDAMTLTYLGYGDSATIQLYKVSKIDPEWRGITCENAFLIYDSTYLSKVERNVWSQFADALENVECDTTTLSREVITTGKLSPIPDILWPENYRHLRLD